MQAGDYVSVKLGNEDFVVFVTDVYTSDDGTNTPMFSGTIEGIYEFAQRDVVDE